MLLQDSDEASFSPVHLTRTWGKPTGLALLRPMQVLLEFCAHFSLGKMKLRGQACSVSPIPALVELGLLLTSINASFMEAAELMSTPHKPRSK